MTQHVTAHAPHIAFLQAQPALAPQTAVLLRVAVELETWAIRRRTRLALSKLDQHLLHDVGLDRRTAFEEARRKFWQG